MNKGFIKRTGLATLALLSITAQLVSAQGRPDTVTNPFATDPLAIVAGKRLFDGICAACHASGGVGSERAPALDSGQFKHGGEDFEVFQTIQKGVAGTQMPAFGASFSAEQTRTGLTILGRRRSLAPSSNARMKSCVYSWRRVLILGRENRTRSRVRGCLVARICLVCWVCVRAKSKTLSQCQLRNHNVTPSFMTFWTLKAILIDIFLIVPER